MSAKLVGRRAKDPAYHAACTDLPAPVGCRVRRNVADMSAARQRASCVTSGATTATGGAQSTTTGSIDEQKMMAEAKMAAEYNKTMAAAMQVEEIQLLCLTEACILVLRA